MNAKTYLLGALLLSAALSCGVRAAKVGEQPPPAPELLFQDLEAYNGAVKALEGKALVVYKEGDKVASLKASIAADKGKTRYRLELFDYVFNKHLVSVVRNGDDVHAALYFRKESYDISYEEFQLQEVTGIAIPKEILFKSMIGEIYVHDGETAVYGEGANSLRLEYTDAHDGLSRETVLFNEDKIPIGATFEQGGESFVVKFIKFKAFGGGLFPVKITIQGGGRSLEINYTELRLNPVLGAQAFNIVGG
jgi:hypothetical protein